MRRHLGRLGRRLCAGARQRDLQQPAVAGRAALRCRAQPRADAGADPAELRGGSGRALLPAVQRDRSSPACRRATSCSRSASTTATATCSPSRRSSVWIRLRGRARLRSQGMRIGVNGGGAAGGPGLCQRSALNVTDANYAPATGQLLSEVGTIIGLQKGPAADQFFLSFDRIGTHTYARTPVTRRHAGAGGSAGPVRHRRAHLRAAEPEHVAHHRRADDQQRRAPDLPAGAAAAAAGAEHRGLPRFAPDGRGAAGHQVLLGDGGYAGRARGVLPGTECGEPPPATQFADAAGKDILVVPLLQKAVGTTSAASRRMR